MEELYGQGDTDPTNVAAALGDHIKIDDKKSGRVGLVICLFGSSNAVASE